MRVVALARKHRGDALAPLFFTAARMRSLSSTSYVALGRIASLDVVELDLSLWM